MWVICPPAGQMPYWLPRKRPEYPSASTLSCKRGFPGLASLDFMELSLLSTAFRSLEPVADMRRSSAAPISRRSRSADGFRLEDEAIDRSRSLALLRSFFLLRSKLLRALGFASIDLRRLFLRMPIYSFFASSFSGAVIEPPAFFIFAAAPSENANALTVTGT